MEAQLVLPDTFDLMPAGADKHTRHRLASQVEERPADLKALVNELLARMEQASVPEVVTQGTSKGGTLELPPFLTQRRARVMQESERCKL